MEYKLDCRVETITIILITRDPRYCNTRGMSYKKRVIRNENWTSPIFGSSKEQTSPFFLK